jgi:hypothetical protein
MRRILPFLIIGAFLAGCEPSSTEARSRPPEKATSHMSIVSQITAEQARYAAVFERGIAAIRAEGPLSRELLISINNDAIPYPYRYIRADIVRSNADGSPGFIQIQGEVDPSVRRKRYNLGGAVVELRPFSWDDAQIAFNVAPRDLAAIERFITTWLDVDDSKRTQDDAPALAIHSASRIETNGALWFLTLDLGTAPPDVLLDLIDLLLDQGATEVYVLSPPRA